MKQKKLHLLTTLISLLILAALCSCVSLKKEKAADYETALFDQSYVHQIDIRISEADWEDLKANPLEKTKYTVDVVIDGEEYREVSFATKGNSSLAFVAADGSSRYSFKISFGKNNKDQSYHGLNKLNLHNGFYDTTYMKDYLSYEVFRQAGVDAPLTSYVWLTVNGEPYGLYIAVEDLGKSFLKRTAGGEGVIYKPESSDLGLTVEKVLALRETGLPIPTENHGSDLVYRDDNPESYPDIFTNAETKTTDEDNLAVIEALKHLAEGSDLESYLYTDQIIAFFAAHNLLLNYDSYTAGMLHNLILYERDGKLSLLPWDYNLAYLSFVPAIINQPLEDATELLNKGIDSPLFGTEEESRPMWSWIARDEQYLDRYHEAMDALVVQYFESGMFEEQARGVHDMILPYVQKDPTAFYSVEEYEEGFEILMELCRRRVRSIRLQLEGSLHTDSAEQQPQSRVDASDLDVSRLGGPDWVY